MDSAIQVLNEEYPTPYIIGPKPSHKHTHTIILLHGTSTSGPEFGEPFTTFPFQFHHSSITYQSNPPQPATPQNQKITMPDLLPGVRFVFPTGKKRKVSVLNGRETNAWFNFHSFTDRTIGEEDNLIGLRESVGFLSGLVGREIEILKASLLARNEEEEGKEEVGGRLVIGGFSQGCAMTAILLLSGELLQYGEWIGGFVGISGWLPFRVQIEEVMAAPLPDETLAELETSVVSKAVIEYVRDLLGLEALGLGGKDKDEKGSLYHEVWISHGELDQKMLIQWGKEMWEVLGGTGCNVVFESEEVGHWWCEGTMEGLSAWLVELWGQSITTKER